MGFLSKKKVLNDPEQTKLINENRARARQKIKETHHKAIKAGIKYLTGTDDANVGLAN